ncbi:DUF2971 domain-containing protein [Vibrio navarrensis]|nr:DUF2971 domain-containing protein [Vibrio navarrensis]EJL6568261.1 DUF2971 domain-containing protein [Vibrio navarrensis]
MYFKFRSLDKYSVTALASNSIWFSNIRHFNDPFETLPILKIKTLESEKIELSHLVTKEFESIDQSKCEYLNVLAKKLGRDDGGFIDNGSQLGGSVNYIIDTIENMKYSVLSLSSDRFSMKSHIATSKLMWSHYANGLRGFCLGFDETTLDERGFFISKNLDERKECNLSVEVKYIDSYLEQSPLKSIKNYLEGDSELEIANLFSVKSNDWCYEDEVRFISPYSGLHRYDSHCLKALVIGEKMPMQERLLLIKLINSTAPTSEIYMAKQSKNCFDIELELIQRASDYI